MAAMLERGHSDETYNARLDRNYADFKTRMERVGRGIHILYQGEDRELYWSTLEELRQARLPFLEEIKDPKIRECIRYLKSKEYVIIPPERVFDPTSIFGSSSEKNGTRKKKKETEFKRSNT